MAAAYNLGQPLANAGTVQLVSGNLQIDNTAITEAWSICPAAWWN